MKQKKIGNKLYVFDLEAYVITADTDAQVIYVQNHVYDAFKALNPSLNIKRYNFNVMATNKPEWYDYINASEVIVEPDEPPVTPPVDKLNPVFEYLSVYDTVSVNYGNSTSGSFWDGLSHQNISEGDIHFTWSSSSNLFSSEDNVYTLSSEATPGEYTVTITAIFDGNETYNPAQATKNITIYVNQQEQQKSTPTVSVSIPQTLYFEGTGASVELSSLESFISSPVAYQFVSLNTTNNASLSDKEPASVYINGFGSSIILEYTTVETNEYAPTTFFIQFTPMQKTAASFNWKNNPLSLTGTEGINPQIQYDLGSSIENNNNNLPLTYSIKSGQGSISNGYFEISGLSEGQYETVIVAEYNSTGVTDMYSSNSTNMTVNITIESGSTTEYPPV